jgi:hypothetical protein
LSPEPFVTPTAEYIQAFSFSIRQRQLEQMTRLAPAPVSSRSLDGLVTGAAASSLLVSIGLAAGLATGNRSSRHTKGAALGATAALLLLLPGLP